MTFERTTDAYSGGFIPENPDTGTSDDGSPDGAFLCAGAGVKN